MTYGFGKKNKKVEKPAQLQPLIEHKIYIKKYVMF
jgi:hypothetical protein